MFWIDTVSLFVNKFTFSYSRFVNSLLFKRGL